MSRLMDSMSANQKRFGPLKQAAAPVGAWMCGLCGASRPFKRPFNPLSFVA